MNVSLLTSGRVILFDTSKPSAYLIRGKRKEFTLKIGHDNKPLFTKLNSDISTSGKGSDILYHTEQTRSGVETQKHLTIEVKVSTEKGDFSKSPTPILRVGFSTKGNDGKTIGVNATLFTIGRQTILLVEEICDEFCFEEASEAFTTNSPEFLSKLKSTGILVR